MVITGAILSTAITLTVRTACAALPAASLTSYVTV